MSIEVFTATIPSGESVSQAIDLGDKVLVGFQMPSDWTDNAYVSFLGSADNVTFDPLTSSGGVIAFGGNPAAAASFWTVSLVDRFYALRYLKVRSGIPVALVNQADDRDIKLIARSLGCSIEVNC